MKTQNGFTMIELIIVIVILGILGAVALPKFIDFSGDAAGAAVRGVAGGLSSASAINYAGAALGKTVTPASGALVGTKAAVCTQANMGALLTSGWPNSGGAYTVAAATAGNANCTAGGSVTCTVSFDPTGSPPAVTQDAEITCY